MDIQATILRRLSSILTTQSYSDIHVLDLTTAKEGDLANFQDSQLFKRMERRHLAGVRIGVSSTMMVHQASASRLQNRAKGSSAGLESGRHGTWMKKAGEELRRESRAAKERGDLPKSGGEARAKGKRTNQ